MGCSGGEGMKMLLRLVTGAAVSYDDMAVRVQCLETRKSCLRPTKVLNTPTTQSAQDSTCT